MEITVGVKDLEFDLFELHEVHIDHSLSLAIGKKRLSDLFLTLGSLSRSPSEEMLLF